jgi:hypothetical protein
MTSTGEKRTPAKMGTRYTTQWPAHLTVEYGPQVDGAPVFGQPTTSFDVYVDGEKVGTVASEAVQQYRKVSKGVRTSTGTRVRWGCSPARQGLTPRPYGAGHITATSRAQATASLIREVFPEHSA